jgi:hypothetical protein
MKNGKALAFIGSCFLVGFYLGLKNKKKMNTFKDYSNLTVENYLNRLNEFDLSEQKDLSFLFFDLIQTGFHPEAAFNLVKEISLEAGEVYND